MLHFLHDRLLINCKHAHNKFWESSIIELFNHQLDICVCMSCNFSTFGSPNYYQHQSSIVHLCTYVHLLHVLHYWLPIIAKWHTSNLMSSQPWQRKNASFRMSFPIKETCFLVPSMFSVHTFCTD